MTRRSEDLAVLGLSLADDTVAKIRKAYLRLSKVHHPDKEGGSKEAFQNLSAAYYRLKSCSEEPRVAAAEQGGGNSSEDDASEEDQSWQTYEDFYADYDNYFHGYGYGDDSFYSWEEEREQRRRAWSEYHKQQKRRGKDYRDGKVTEQSVICMFCGERPAITEAKATQNGLSWDEYSESTEVEGYPAYFTCWICKDKHISVLTEKMACTKFIRNQVSCLNVTAESRYGEYNPIFWELRRAGRSFRHQPVTNMYDGPTNVSKYYWYPDLERIALARGWMPGVK